MPGDRRPALVSSINCADDESIGRDVCPYYNARHTIRLLSDKSACPNTRIHSGQTARYCRSPVTLGHQRDTALPESAERGARPGIDALICRYEGGRVRRQLYSNRALLSLPSARVAYDHLVLRGPSIHYTRT